MGRNRRGLRDGTGPYGGKFGGIGRRRRLGKRCPVTSRRKAK